MSLDADLVPLLLAVALVSYLCRAGGFFLMRFVPRSDALDAALKATPLGVMAGIVAMTAIRGRPEELAALGAVALVMLATRNDLAAALAGAATLALMRAIMGV